MFCFVRFVALLVAWCWWVCAVERFFDVGLVISFRVVWLAWFGGFRWIVCVFVWFVAV